MGNIIGTASDPARSRPRVWFCGLSLITILLGTISAFAQNNAQPPAPHKFLLVVETSRSMKPRVSASAAVTKELLDSKFQGQLRKGDLVGVWTFDQELRTNAVSFRELSPESSVAVLGAVLGAKYDERTDPSSVWVPVSRALFVTPQLTLILISAGEGELVGTPVDREVNDAWNKWRDTQRKVRQPIITLLRSHSGKITDWSVTPMPSNVKLPPLQLEPNTTIAKETTPAPPLALTNPPPITTNPTPTTIPLAAKPTPKPTTNTIAPPMVRASVIPTNSAPGSTTQLVVRAAVTTNPGPAIAQEPPKPTITAAAPTNTIPTEIAVAQPKPPAPNERTNPVTSTRAPNVPAAVTTNPEPAISQEPPKPTITAAASTNTVPTEITAASPKPLAPRKTNTVTPSRAPETASPTPPKPAVHTPPTPVAAPQTTSVPHVVSTSSNSETAPATRDQTLASTSQKTVSKAADPVMVPSEAILPTPVQARNPDANRSLWIGVIIVLGLGAAFCFWMWLSTYRR